MAEAVNCIVKDTDVQRVFQGMLRFTGNTRPVMEEIGQKYEAGVLKNFANESDPEGRKWQKLSAVTMLIRLGKGKRTKKSGYLSKSGTRYLQAKMILQDKRHLLGAVHYQATALSVTIGVGGHIKYGAIHQFGGMAGRGHKTKIPARPYLAMNEGTHMRLAARDKQMILETLHLRLADAIDGRR